MFSFIKGIIMRKFTFLMCLCTLAVLAGTVSAAELKIMSYNVRNCKGMSDEEIRLERTAGVIRSVAPDIAGIQELDRNAVRCGKRDIPQELGEAAQMQAFYAPAIDFQGGKYGIGTLTKRKPLKSWNVPLPGTEEKRTLQITEFEEYVFFNTHFSLTSEDRLKSVSIINSERAKFEKPVILCGDFNAFPDSPEIQELQKTWKILTPDAPTFPASSPNIRIDYIMISTSKSYQILESRVVEAPEESDHRPVYVRIGYEN